MFYCQRFFYYTSPVIQDINIPSKDFVFLHPVSPLLLFTYTLYPRIYNPFTLKDYLGLAMELINIFEMITDLKYIHNYNSIWVAVSL